MNKKPFLYGLNKSNHDFSQRSSLGKNIFTNAFPIALAQYLSLEKGFDIPLIEAVISDDGNLKTQQTPTPWSKIIEADPSEASFLFESVYDEYRKYTNRTPNQSDIVVSLPDKRHTRAFEVKLVVIPNSATANRPHDKQSCEIVVRPPSVEQLAFSIAASYGSAKRTELLEIISDSLVNPMDYQWSSKDFMLKHMHLIEKAVAQIIKNAISLQTPFAITAIWRTEGQRPVLEENAFDVFVWTDMAFAQLFLEKSNAKGNITRPQRSMIWLVSALFDYAAQKTLNFGKHHSRITFDAQTDKAGAFAGDTPYQFLQGKNLFSPRVTRSELESIVTREAFEYLMPERRLDAAIVIQHLLNSSSSR